MAISLQHVREELLNVVANYPLWPGDTISHETARLCEARGWIRRQADGNWIPTASGVREAERLTQQETPDA